VAHLLLFKQEKLEKNKQLNLFFLTSNCRGVNGARVCQFSKPFQNLWKTRHRLSFYSNISVKFAQNYEKLWIPVIQQFIGIHSKSNVTTCHKNGKHETLCCESSRFDIIFQQFRLLTK